MSFSDLKLNQQILDILKANNIDEPTEIQTKAIPHVLNGGDLMGVSKTGTGKTLAFLLPILSKLLKSDKSFYCLILTPTRELAIQISKNIAIFSSLGVRSTLLIGGEPVANQIEKLQEHPHIIVGTPGRIYKHINNLKLSRFRIVVLDEADRFCEEDYKKPMESIMGALRPGVQKLMFTATLTESLTGSLGKAVIVDVTKQSSKISKLDEFYFLVPRRFKECFLYSFCQNGLGYKIIVFVNMKVTAIFLSNVLHNMSIENDYLIGEQKQSKRELVMDGFRSNKFNVLICTDVGSRGLDIPDIDYVINYDIPSKVQDYTHRIGRTARAETTGSSITLVTQYDLPTFQRIEHELGRKLELFNFEKDFKAHEEQFEAIKAKSYEQLKEEKENKQDAPQKKRFKKKR